jgi:ABC-type Mn2+/Zn2+ transport system permease subunit
MAACASGVCLSYFQDLPYGPTLILCLGLVFLVAVGIRAALPATARS